MSDPIVVKVDRSRWIRGTDDGFLLRPSDKKMCCLGFVALALGRTEDQIMGMPAPASRVREGIVLNGDMFPEQACRGTVLLEDSHGRWYEPENIGLAMSVNDNAKSSDAYKEERLTELLGGFGIKLEFVG